MDKMVEFIEETAKAKSKKVDDNRKGRNASRVYNKNSNLPTDKPVRGNALQTQADELPAI